MCLIRFTSSFVFDVGVFVNGNVVSCCLHPFYAVIFADVDVDDVVVIFVNIDVVVIFCCLSSSPSFLSIMLFCVFGSVSDSVYSLFNHCGKKEASFT